MLKNLFISKVRIKILEKFLFNPGVGYHVRGLVRELSEEINAVRRELLNLKAIGFLKVEKEGNKLVYTIDDTCPIISELRSLMYKDSELGTHILEVGRNIGNIDLIILTHCFMSKKYENDLDVDLLFVGSFDIRKLSNEMKEVEKSLNRDLRYSAMTPQDFDFAKKKRTPFLLNILSQDMVVLLGSEKALAL